MRNDAPLHSLTETGECEEPTAYTFEGTADMAFEVMR